MPSVRTDFRGRPLLNQHGPIPHSSTPALSVHFCSSGRRSFRTGYPRRARVSRIRVKQRWIVVIVIGTRKPLLVASSVWGATIKRKLQ